MSYILDALKKSDQQRQQNNGPTLQTVQHSQVMQPNAVGVPWLIAITALLFAVLLALAAWYYFTVLAKKPPLTASVAAPVTAPVTSVSTTSLENTDQPLQSSSSQAVAVPPTAADQAAPVIPDTPQAAAKPAAVSRQPVVEMWQLPDTVQQQLPAMTFSFHVYSDNPERRTIIINNRRVKQGDTVAQDLLLEEITPQGVVLQWQQLHRFTINVVENW